jgi:CubicO group peptidase (beta-lactamase class C family)
MRTIAALLLALTIDAKELQTLLDRVIPAEMEKQQIPGAAFVLVQNGRVVLSKGYGFADVARKKPVSAETTIFPIGSITKVFTAMAVVQLADRGQIDLNADVNRYLKTTKVPATYPAPVTPRHLLTHTGGFDELRGRLLQSADERVQPLDRFLATRLVRVRPPGVMTAYSSFGTTLAGLLVEDVSGLPFERYLARNIFTPLKMSRTQITTPKTLMDDLAVAYEVDGGKVVAVPYERYHSTPASSITSSASDMGRFMLAVLGEGSLQGSRILSEKATREMSRQQITMHPRLPGFGYGFQISDTNGQRIIEHGGNIGGFHSLMVMLPDHETGFYIVAHREGADLRSPVRKAILDRWFPLTRRFAPPSPASGRGGLEVAGTYRANIWCHTCPFDPDRVQDVRVTANADGSINVWDERWIEVEPLFFRSPDGRRRIGFHADANGKITALTSGSWMVMERLPDRNP